MLQRGFASRLAIVTLIGAAASCHSPTSPTTGQDAVTIVDVVPDSGGVAPLGGYAVARIQFEVTSDLEAPTIFAGVPVPNSYQVWVCPSVDGIHFASDCQSVSGSQRIAIQGAVHSPAVGPTQTSYVLAFMIKASDYYNLGHPPIEAGGTIPPFTLAKDVKPWVINWK